MFEYTFLLFFVFFFNDTATTEIYTSVHTLSLHDALPISGVRLRHPDPGHGRDRRHRRSEEHTSELQSRTLISYAVFCLKKKKTKKTIYNPSTDIIIKKKKQNKILIIIKS